MAILSPCEFQKHKINHYMLHNIPLLGDTLDSTNMKLPIFIHFVPSKIIISYWGDIC